MDFIERILSKFDFSLFQKDYFDKNINDLEIYL